MRTCGVRKTENGKHYHCVDPVDHLGDHAWTQDLMGDLEAGLETAAPCDISDAEKPCDSTDAAPGSLIGYLVILREHEARNDSWDGTIHADAEAALKSCTEAFEAGYDAVLTEVRIK